MSRTRKYAELTEQQDEALQSYAEWCGEGWKVQLSYDWMNAGSNYPGEWCELQRLRNTHGPSWLASL